MQVTVIAYISKSICRDRSGTTFVHRLLSLDPAARGPRLWELIKSVPGVAATASDAENLLDRQNRAAYVKKQVDIRLMMGMRTMEQFHEIGFDLQEECLFGLSEEAPIGLHFVFAAGKSVMVCPVSLFTCLGAKLAPRSPGSA